MQKNRNKLICFLMLAFWLASFLLPQNSFAADIPTSQPKTVAADGTVCPDSHKGLVVRIVPCIRDTVLYATTKIFGTMANIVAKTVAVACTLAIAIWGIRIIMGQASVITKDGIILAIKIGVIGLFTSKYAVIFPKMINVVEDLLNIVAKPSILLIWKATSCNIKFTGSDAKIMEIFGAIDCYLNYLIGGIFNTVDIKNGIVGFLFSLASSNVAGFFMAGIGFYLIFISLMTIAKSLFIFLQAFIAGSLMFIISPLFVPMVLFKSTEKYFKQWLTMTISFIVQPVILMGYLGMFLMAFDATIFHGNHSLYYSIVGSASDDKSGDFKIGEWLRNNGVYAEKSLNNKGNNIDSKGAKEALGDDKTIDKGVVSKEGQHPECEGSISNDCVKMRTAAAVTESMGFGDVQGIATKGLNYFRTDTAIQALDWAALSSKVDADGCNKVNCTLSDATDEQKKKIDDYLTKRKIKVFLTFIMSLIMIYVFYTLLDQIPLIGSGLMHDSVARISLGKSSTPKTTNSGGGQ